MPIYRVYTGWYRDEKKHNTVRATYQENDNTRATSLVSMKSEEKKLFTRIAENHGLSLSSLFRFVADEYITKHDW